GDVPVEAALQADALEPQGNVFGGTAEYVALWFKSVGLESGFYWYVTACIACSLLVYVFMKDTQKHSKITTD
ncbi:hypothetical protein CDO43_38405, partial [Pseudomonas aeruginosa]